MSNPTYTTVRSKAAVLSHTNRVGSTSVEQVGVTVVQELGYRVVVVAATGLGRGGLVQRRA